MSRIVHPRYAPVLPTDEELAAMDDETLSMFEDDLLLYAELNVGRETQTSMPRVLVFAASALLSLACLLVLAELVPALRTGPLSVLLVLAGMGLGTALAQRLWRAIGRRARMVIRALLRHWPATLYVVVQAWVLLRSP
jgi:hypothetical protein